MQMKKWENEYRTTIVCIDGYENQVPTGRFYNLHYEDGVRFHGVMDLIKKMEDMLDQMKFPQSYSLVRTFSKAPSPTCSQLIRGNKPHYGDLATFTVRVLFRQNASWQGNILWMEGKREEGFRSVLEMLFLMDSAIELEGEYKVGSLRETRYYNE